MLELNVGEMLITPIVPTMFLRQFLAVLKSIHTEVDNILLADNKLSKKQSSPMSLSAKEEVCIVDEDNNVIGKADRSVMRAFNLPHRASYIVIKNSSGQFYVQRRTMIKDYCPGMLDPMTGGVVQFGEPMDVNAQREAEEEMGVKDTQLRYLTTFYYGDDRSRVWGGLFDCTFDSPLVLQEEEVDEVLTMTADEILTRRKEFTPDGIFAFEKYLAFVEKEGK